MPAAVPFILGVLLATAIASVIALFVRGDGTQLWDIVKLCLQGIGGIVIARLAVVWQKESSG